MSFVSEDTSYKIQFVGHSYFPGRYEVVKLESKPFRFSTLSLDTFALTTPFTMSRTVQQ